MAGYDFTDFMRRDRTVPLTTQEAEAVLTELNFVINSICCEFHDGRKPSISDELSTGWLKVHNVTQRLKAHNAAEAQ